MKHNVVNTMWDCDKCDQGCDEDGQKVIPGFQFHPDLPSTTINMCPVAYMQYKMDPYCLYLFELYSEFKRYNHLHFPGCLNDQPWWLIKAFDVIQNAINYVENLDDRKSKRGMQASKAKIGAMARKGK